MAKCQLRRSCRVLRQSAVINDHLNFPLILIQGSGFRFQRSQYRLKMDVDGIAEDQGSAKIKEEHDMQVIETQAEQALTALNFSMLKKTNVLPNTGYSGHVVMEKIANQAHEIKVIITAAGEEHEFLLNYVKGQ